MTCGTESCTVTLSYARSTTATAGPFTTIPVTKISADTQMPIGALTTWRAVIPAAHVIEPDESRFRLSGWVRLRPCLRRSAAFGGRSSAVVRAGPSWFV